VCHEIASGQLSIDHLDKFPHGLGGIYAAFFERQFPDTADYAKRFRPVLEVVAAAREPLQLDYLAGVFNWSDYDIVEIPNAVGSLFSQRFGRLEPFHLSVLDWLKDKNKAGRYFVSVNNGGKRLADHAWDEFLSWSEDRARKVFDYSIIHLPAHLEAVPDGVDKLSKLLMNFDWMQAKLGKTDVVALMKDYRRRDILELAPVRDVLRRAALALQRDRSLLAGQLLGRLPDFIHASLKPLLDGARKNSSDPWLRPKGATLINAGHPLHTTLWGHKGTVRSVAISADGTRAVTAGNSSPDQTLRFWDLEFGVEIARLEGQAEAGSYTPVAVLPNGNWALCAFQNQINVWDLRTAEKTTSLSGHAESVSAVAISSSGDRAISASHTGEVLVWDLTAWRQLGAPLNQGEAVWSVGISADGTIGVSGSENLIKVWDLVQQTELSSFQGQTGYWGRWPRPLLLVGANSFIYFGDPMRVWNWRENTFTPAPENMVGQVLAGDAEGKQLVVYRERQNLELWDFEKPTQIGAIDGTESFLSAVAMTPDRNWLIDAFFDHEVRVWDLAAFSRMDPEGKLIAKLSPIQSWAELRFPVSDQFEASAITPAPEASSTSVTESTAKTIDLSSLRKTAAPARKGPIKRGQPVILGDYFALSFAPEDWVLTIFDVRNGKTITSFVFDAPIRQCSVEPDETIRVSEISGRVHSLVFENPPA
jgi:WD40 repeat protein